MKRQNEAQLPLFDQITPVILTYNEAPNIERALEQLRWARDIVVVDSFSNDATLESISRAIRNSQSEIRGSKSLEHVRHLWSN